MDSAIKERSLRLSPRRQGNPKDMLDLVSISKQSLGIDTVKQAEMFAAVRAAYNIPRDENGKAA